MARKPMNATERAIIDLMTQPSDERTDARRGIIGYRTRRIIHGPMMDVLVYPIYSRAFRPEVRAAIAEHKPTREAQRLINHRRSQDRLIRLANHNFEDGDQLLTITFREPEGDEAAKREIRKWERRMRRYWRKRGRELKYLCTLEVTESEMHGRNYHLHAIVNGHGFDRNEIEHIWGNGFCNTRSHQANDKQFGGFAAYLTVYKPKQEKAGRKAWWGSRNLIQPPETYSDHRMSTHKMERIARGMEKDGQFWVEKAFPKYRCIDEVICRRSDFVPGAYMFARMRLRD